MSRQHRSSCCPMPTITSITPTKLMWSARCVRSSQGCTDLRSRQRPMAYKHEVSFFGAQRHNNRSPAAHAIVLAFLLSFTNSYGWTQISIPKTPSGRVLRAWLDAVNSGNPAKIQAYVRSIDSAQTVDWLLGLSQHSGGFSLLSVTSKGPRLISFHVKEKESATEAFGSIRVRDSTQLRVLS